MTRGPKGESLQDYDEIQQSLVDSGSFHSLYIHQASQEPLLSHDQEIELAKVIEQGRKAKRILESGAEHNPDDVERLNAVVGEAQSAREHLARANTRLVIQIASKYKSSGLAPMDIIQEGNVGLMQAVDKFDHTKGFRFATYATWWIKQKVRKGIALKSRTIKLPTYITDEFRKIVKATQLLTQELQRYPTDAEIAEYLSIDETTVKGRLAENEIRTISLLSEIGEGGDYLEEVVPDTVAQSPEEVAEDNSLESELVKRIADLFSRLTEREVRILKLRFGFVDGEEWTLQAIGNKYGITRERVRQIESKAMSKLRN